MRATSPPSTRRTRLGHSSGRRTAHASSPSPRSSLYYRYRFSLLNLVAPALRESTETCLKLSEQGLLNLMVKFASPETPDRYAFVEFYVCPLVEDDDEAFTTTQGG